MKDYLVRGLVNSKNCRVFACTTTNLTNVAQQNHNLWPCASACTWTYDGSHFNDGCYE